MVDFLHGPVNQEPYRVCRSSHSTSAFDTCSGWSVISTWFAFGIITSSASGMRPAMMRPFSGGTSASSSPCTTSVGAVMRAMRS